MLWVMEDGFMPALRDPASRVPSRPRFAEVQDPREAISANSPTPAERSLACKARGCQGMPGVSLARFKGIWGIWLLGSWFHWGLSRRFQGLQ